MARRNVTRIATVLYNYGPLSRGERLRYDIFLVARFFSAAVRGKQHRIPIRQKPWAIDLFFLARFNDDLGDAAIL